MQSEAIVIETGVVPHVYTPPGERRAHPRLRASELRGLKTARVKYGADVTVIDLSAGGMLFETGGSLTPNSTLVLELASRKRTLLVPSRLLRCHEVRVNDALRYTGACEFRRPLALDEFVAGDLPALAHGSAAEWQAVVVRYRDGFALNGYTNDFHPSKAYFSFSTMPMAADARFTQIAQVDALYFPRRADDTQIAAGATHGRKIEVTLPRGEILVGATLNYRRDGNGFFVHPADPLSEYARVFVTAGAIRHVRFL